MTRSRSAALAALAGLTAIAGASALTTGAAADQGVPPNGRGTAGPPYDYATQLSGGYGFIPLPDQAALTRSEHGYLFRAGQQDSHLVVTLTDAGLRFADTGTERFKRLAGACHREAAEVGIAAVCDVPDGITTAQPLLVEVWPRLGDDFVDGSSLPATVAMTVLSDAGDDVAMLGAGPDFFNGYTGRDQVWAGGGNDWIRTGDGADRVWGGSGDDQLVGTDGRDTFYGETGDDRLGGGAGADRLDGGPGSDVAACDAGVDTAWSDGADRLRSCEQVNQS